MDCKKGFKGFGISIRPWPKPIPSFQELGHKAGEAVKPILKPQDTVKVEETKDGLGWKVRAERKL